MTTPDEIKQRITEYLASKDTPPLVLGTVADDGHIDFSLDTFLALNPDLQCSDAMTFALWYEWMEQTAQANLKAVEKHLTDTPDKGIPF